MGDVFTVEATGEQTLTRRGWVAEFAFKRNGTTLSIGPESHCEKQKAGYEAAVAKDPSFNPLRGINGVFG